MNKPMFTLSGVVIHVYETPKGVNKTTGEEYGGQDKVQIMGFSPLPNGESMKEVINLTTDQGSALKKLEGRSVSAPISFYAPSKGQVSYFIPKGHTITPEGNAGN